LNIYVGNLPLELTENELRLEFKPFGEVLAVTIMNDKYIGSGKDGVMAFVEMVSKSEAQVAMVN
jgi:RNA recognition motif-containing protein